MAKQLACECAGGPAKCALPAIPAQDILAGIMVQPSHEPNEGPSGDSVLLSLFPLNLVLFPGMPLPLHIFEERYKTMIGECRDTQQPFGVVLIKEGLEVGEPAEPFMTGASARIIQVDELDDGRMNILTQGEHRFQVMEITQNAPYLVAHVQYLIEEPGETPTQLLAEIIEGYSVYLRNIEALSGGWTASAQLPQDPVLLSYALAGSLDIPTMIRQQLLESATAAHRLEILAPLLKRGNEILQEEVVKRNPFQGPRLN